MSCQVSLGTSDLRAVHHDQSIPIDWSEGGLGYYGEGETDGTQALGGPHANAAVKHLWNLCSMFNEWMERIFFSGIQLFWIKLCRSAKKPSLAFQGIIVCFCQKDLELNRPWQFAKPHSTQQDILGFFNVIIWCNPWVGLERPVPTPLSGFACRPDVESGTEATLLNIHQNLMPSVFLRHTTTQFKSPTPQPIHHGYLFPLNRFEVYSQRFQRGKK